MTQTKRRVIRDYSQDGEQAAILEWAKPYTGSFVDLGCYDGEKYSNTAALADLGWTGICVDAAPDAAAACAKRYAKNPRVEVIAAAFTATREPAVTIHWTAGAMYSGFVPNERDDIAAPVPIDVPSLDLDWFAERLAQMPAPLFCSIDLEGLSLAALRWLLDNANPQCICVEANNPDDRQAVCDMLDGWVEIPLDNHVNLVFRR